MLWLTDDPMPARITAEMPALVVLTIMSAGRSEFTDMGIVLPVYI
jgi:hypothetical protein